MAPLSTNSKINNRIVVSHFNADEEEQAYHFSNALSSAKEPLPIKGASNGNNKFRNIVSTVDEGDDGEDDEGDDEDPEEEGDDEQSDDPQLTGKVTLAIVRPSTTRRRRRRTRTLTSTGFSTATRTFRPTRTTAAITTAFSEASFPTTTSGGNDGLPTTTLSLATSTASFSSVSPSTTLSINPNDPFDQTDLTRLRNPSTPGTTTSVVPAVPPSQADPTFGIEESKAGSNSPPGIFGLPSGVSTGVISAVAVGLAIALLVAVGLVVARRRNKRIEDEKIASVDVRRGSRGGRPISIISPGRNGGVGPVGVPRNVLDGRMSTMMWMNAAAAGEAAGAAMPAESARTYSEEAGYIGAAPAASPRNFSEESGYIRAPKPLPAAQTASIGHPSDLHQSVYTTMSGAPQIAALSIARTSSPELMRDFYRDRAPRHVEDEESDDEGLKLLASGTQTPKQQWEDDGEVVVVGESEYPHRHRESMDSDELLDHEHSEMSTQSRLERESAPSSPVSRHSTFSFSTFSPSAAYNQPERNSRILSKLNPNARTRSPGGSMVGSSRNSMIGKRASRKEAIINQMELAVALREALEKSKSKAEEGGRVFGLEEARWDLDSGSVVRDQSEEAMR
ncbi:hypothetical protein HDU97_006738 [Phlyctochytrium planicorne]|nr:hypothetical protein HDU97_006738 [Phlyctochytrium planicorne]